MDLKKVAVDLFKNGETISDIARVLQQPRSTKKPSIIRRFREAGTVENQEDPAPWMTGTIGSWRNGPR